MNKELQFLPVSREDMEARGWDHVDFAYVIGDAYVDHPSFGHAVISRVLESRGFKVGIISQPDWRDPESVSVFGEPRLGFLVSAGNMDSMVNHYSVSKKRRKTDAYTPGGEMGKRPDYACVVYGNLIRQTYKKTPVILGGIEASLRRLAHYDYWSDRLKRSVLLDSGADLISYGMGERSIVEIAEALDAGIPVEELTYIDGTVAKVRDRERITDAEFLPSFDELKADRSCYASSFYTQYRNTDAFNGKRLAEPYSEHLWVVQNPPARPLDTQEMDDVYSLPYQRTFHPSYEEKGGVPAIAEIRFSLISSRGCFGGCSFCALTFHQGRIVQVRSHGSLIREAEAIAGEESFKGYIHDVGGPTANFRHPSCQKQMKTGVCRNRQCLWPSPCPNLDADHSDYVALLKRLRAVPGVKKVFIRSGIRFDYLLADRKQEFLRELCEYHVSGQLKVAPEHVASPVLSLMGKPPHSVYEEFTRQFEKMNRRIGKKQYLVPYLMSSHPGSTLREAVELAEYCRDLGYMPEQVQDFYPTPSTLSTCMYYTGLDPRTMQPVYVPKDPHEKAMQRALIQYRNPKLYDLVYEALCRAGRTDLIGYGPKCLIRPRGGRDGRAPDGGRKNGKSGRGGGKNARQSRAAAKAGTEREPLSRSGGRKKKTIRNVHKKK